MRAYWLKIGLGALGIFVLGYSGILAVRSAKHGVERVVHSTADIALPLPFVHFMLDGNSAGKFRRLVLHRSDPEHLNGIDLSVRVSNQEALARLRSDCVLTVDDPKRLGSKMTFRCVEADSTMQDFGAVTVEAQGQDGEWVEAAVVRLVVPRTVAASLAGTQVTAAFAGAEADELKALADSMGVVSAKLGTVSEAERVALRAELRRLRTEMRDVERAVAVLTRERLKAEVGAAAPRVQVDVDVPDVPTPPPAATRNR